MLRPCLLKIVCLLFALAPVTHAGEEKLRLATFNVDATPAVGTPVAYAPVRKILDPLSARGVVLLGAGKPIVLCAVDWIGIANAGYDAWRAGLAEAAGTDVERVCVHALHQHDGPRCDFTAEAILAERGYGGVHTDVRFCREVIARAGQAIENALEDAQPVTHLGVGAAKVEKVASNRRLLGPDGRVKMMRFSSSRNPDAIAAPEGVIDPVLRCISFYNGDETLAVLTYYATHPQSYYGQGDVTSEFVGLARNQREEKLGVLHVHFNGASGNVAAGKYNDGSKERRPVLAARMADGMQRAWEATQKRTLTAADVQYRVETVQLPLGEHVKIPALKAALAEDKLRDLSVPQRKTLAKHLAFSQRVAAGKRINLSCLQLGNVYLLHMPGELFVEYQLAAQAMRPDDVVCMAAYGEYGPGYIGTAISYTQGGYETSQGASRVGPASEEVLLAAMRKLLQVK